MFWSNERLAGEIYQRILSRRRDDIDHTLILETIEEYQHMLEEEGIEYYPGQIFYVPDE